MNNIAYKIEKQLPNLTKAQRRIAEELLTNTKEAIHYSTDELASQCQVSHAAISRFCYLFDFYGLKDLQISLAQDITYLDDFKLVSPESKEFSENIAENVFAQTTIAMKNTYEMLESEVILEATRLMFHAKKIYLYGIGASSIVARDFLQKLLRIQVDATIFEEYDMMRLSLIQASQMDVLIAVSYSGKKEEVVRLAKQAHNQGVPIIAITKDGDSELAQLATYVIPVAGLESEFRSSALSSRIVQLYVVDVLFHTYCALLGPERVELVQTTFDVIR